MVSIKKILVSSQNKTAFILQMNWKIGSESVQPNTHTVSIVKMRSLIPHIFNSVLSSTNNVLFYIFPLLEKKECLHHFISCPATLTYSFVHIYRYFVTKTSSIVLCRMLTISICIRCRLQSVIFKKCLTYTLHIHKYVKSVHCKQSFNTH